MSGSKDWLFRIEDMIEHIQKIRDKLSTTSQSAFLGDDFLQAGIERYFEIIGEAARHVPKNIQARYPDIDWSSIIGMRHKISHDYLDIDAKTLWEVYAQDFFGLEPHLIELLRKEDK